MFGVLLTLIFCLASALAIRPLVSKLILDADPAEKFGVSGLVGLGTLGMFVFAVGLMPGGLGLIVPLVGVVVAAGAVVGFRSGALTDFRFRAPTGAGLAVLVAIVLLGLIGLIGVLAPSTTLDWDTIAYHLAVPKLWLERGQIGLIQGMHQSNFPFTVECLFMLGLEWGGQAGAKAFSLAYLVFGSFAVFGLARRWYGATAGWWSLLAFAGIPIVCWESGTGYIDVAHGLYATIGLCYAIENLAGAGAVSRWVMAGIGLGFAIGTKYTGLQVVGAFVAVALLYGFVGRNLMKTLNGVAITVLAAVVVGGAWYVKTAVYTGNPVFPFFSSVLGGRDWDEWRASVYKDEQKSFGVGTAPTDLGHAVLGLAYQPGRYTNPGQNVGAGFPSGAVGFAVLLVGVGAALSGGGDRKKRIVLGVVGLGLLGWFVLSQQSRYLTVYMVPLAILAGGEVAKSRWGRVLAGAVALQAAMTAMVMARFQTMDQIKVAIGTVPQDAYLSERLAIYRARPFFESLPNDSRIALYDEVFGFYIDRSYFWANPGHSMLIPYDRVSNAAQYVAAMRDQRFTHIYVNLSTGDSRFVSALGLGASSVAYSEEERAAMMPDLNLKWKVLVSDAVRSGLIKLEQTFGTSAVYSLNGPS